MKKTKTVKAVISGKVQGVFYRMETKKAADRINVKGWVRNLPDGCVEAVFESDESTLEKMIAWCHQGSPGALVSRVDIKSYPQDNGFNSFDIRY